MKKELVVLLVFASVSFAGMPDTLWTAAIGSTDAEQAYDACLAADGGYVGAGFTESYGNGMSDVFLVKVGFGGSVEWKKTYGGTGIDQARSVLLLADGGYAVAGETWSHGAGLSDVWLLRTDSDGDTLWTRTYGGTGFDAGYSVAAASGNGLIVAGFTTSYGSGGYDLWLLRLDSAGDTLWTRTYGGTANDQAYNCAGSADNGFIITGYSASGGAGSNDLWVLKTDASGDTAWTRLYGGTSSDMGRSVLELGDGYLVTGHTASFGSGGTDIWLLRIDTAGDTLWARTWGGAQHDYGYSAGPAVDGGFVVTGKSESYGNGRDDIWLLRTNAAGDTLWTGTYGGMDNDIAYRTLQRPDGRFFWAGGTKSYGAGNYDVWLLAAAADQGAPDNDMSLTAVKIADNTVALSWNPSAVDSADADSTGIWYRNDRYPAYANEPGATKAGGYALTDSVDTLTGLTGGKIYYFALLAKDSSGYWSDTAGTALDTAFVESVDWWHPDWERRVRLRFDNAFLSDTLNDVPVLVKLHSGRVNYTDFNAGGSDLRFVDLDNSTVLAHEVERWDAGGTSYVWVNVPDICGSGAGDSIWMYYRNPAAADSQDTAGVWGSGYAGVWHLGNNLRDNTLNDHDAVDNGSITAPGIAGNARSFDGADDYLAVADHDSLSFGNGSTDRAFSISAWVRMDDATNFDIFTKYDADGHAREYAFRTQFQDKLLIGLIDESTGGSLIRYYDAPLTGYEGSWVHACVTYDGTADVNGIRLYFNGERVDDVTGSSGSYAAMENRAADAYIGRLGDPPLFADGAVDELRVARTAFSQDRIRCQYRAVMDSLMTWGVVVVMPKPARPIPVDVPAGETEPVLRILNTPVAADGAIGISYDVSGSPSVITQVAFDLLDGFGTIKAHIADLQQYPGRHLFSWNGTDSHGRNVLKDLFPGVYVLRMRTGARIRQTKFIVVR